MYRGRTIAVVVPAYNEAAHVAEVLETIPDFVDRIYAVDDRSTDETWEIIQSLVSDERDRKSTAIAIGDREAATTDRAPAGRVAGGSITDGGTPVTQRIVPIRHERNRGAGAALRTGYLRALGDGIDLVVTMDADGQMDPAYLPRLLDPIVEDEADYAKGNRLSGSDTTGMPSFRLFGNWLLTVLTKFASGYWGINDPQNGYTAISYGALARVGIERLPDDHNYTNDLLCRLNALELRVADVSMPPVYNDEESTIRYRTFIPRTSATLVSGFIHRLRAKVKRRPTHPVTWLYAGAAMCVLASLVQSIVTLGYSTGVPDRRLPSVFVLGLSLVVAAVLLDARSSRPLEVTA